MQNEFLKEAVHDDKDNNLVNACLLRFPYGRGGLHELRLKVDGTSTSSIDIEEYIQHLSQIAQPRFQQDLFQLILYNMFAKQQMVKKASLKVRRNTNAIALAQELTVQDVGQAVSAKSNGRVNSSSGTGGQFVNAVDASAWAVL
jgi:hypothetical protein